MIEAKTGVAGRYRLSKCKADANGKPIESTRVTCADWFDNLILDQGLDYLGDQNGPSELFNYFKVGSGGTAPTVSDTGMESFIANSNINDEASDAGVAQDGSSNWYVYLKETKRFPTGTAEGNLAEVGVGPSTGSGSVFSRALIRDSNGDPTTITVLSDEILDVTYELRIFPPTQDVTGTVDIGGVTYNYTARAAEVDNHNFTRGWYLSSQSGIEVRNGVAAYDGNIGGVEDSPSGFSNDNSAAIDGSYTAGSYEANGSAQWGLNEANFASGVRSMRMRIGWGTWQVEFSNASDGTAIPKDETKELTLGMTHSWARV